MEPGSLKAVTAASLVVGGRASQSVSVEKAGSGSASATGEASSGQKKQRGSKELAVASSGASAEAVSAKGGGDCAFKRPVVVCSSVAQLSLGV